MVLRKRIKDIVFILLVLILVFTILFFSDGMSKSAAEENKYASGLEAAITTSSYLFNAFVLFYPLIILLGAAAYFLYSSHKSRYGMVLASGLVLSSTPSFVAAWLWVIGIRSMGVQWEQFGIFDREQIAGVLFNVC